VQATVLYFQPGMLLGPHSTLAFYSGAVVSNGVLAHFFTPTSFQEACAALGSPSVAGWRGLWWLGMEAGAAIYLGAAALFSAKAGRAGRLLCTAAIFSLALGFKRNGAINEELMCGSGGRYFFAFNLLVGLMLLVFWTRKVPRWSTAAGVLIAGAIVSGALELRVDGWWKWHEPIWADQVAAWRVDPARAVQIRPGYWPGVKLTPRPGNNALPPSIYDTTKPGWREK
jgi:hypothetical protein